MNLLAAHGAVDAYAVIRRERTLPRPGDVLKRPGQTVGALDVVARARVPQDHHIVDVAHQLRVSPQHVDRYILKRPGETVDEGEPIAARRGAAGVRRIVARSPIEGEVVDSGRGIVVLEGEPRLIEVKASMSGVVVDVVPNLGVVIETEGSRVKLAWGRGELSFSELTVLEADEDGLPDSAMLDAMEHRGLIVAVPAPLTAPFLQMAAEASVAAVVGASMDAELVSLSEELGLTVAVSEGFGFLQMSGDVVELLKANAGRQLTLDPGAMEGWRTSRPEIIIRLDDEETPAGNPALAERVGFLEVGQRVRVLRGPHRGAIVRVVTLPERPRHLPSGLALMGAEVRINDDEVAFVPFANLEHLG
jgi:hypothetical protein